MSLNTVKNSFHSKHAHDFVGNSAHKERKVLAVFWLTLITMVAEIVVGTWSGSMGLLADGWHMGTHAAAFALAMFTYSYARKHRNDDSFSFGTGKVNYLGGFASAIALAMVALYMAVESIERLINPQSIHYLSAITVAIVGLVVNIISVLILHEGHEHDHESHHHDHNLKAAYYHVLADALTSILAIFALLAGRYLNWLWMDAVIGIVGSIIIARWAYVLLGDTGRVLLDRNVTGVNPTEIKRQLECDNGLVVNDLHIWTIAEHHNAVILSVTAGKDSSVAKIKENVRALIPNLSHITIEVEVRGAAVLGDT